MVGAAPVDALLGSQVPKSVSSATILGTMTPDDRARRSTLPKEPDLYHPTLEALEALGGSGTVQEITDRVIELEGFTDEQQAIMHRGGRQSEIAYRLLWARTSLKGIGALEDSSPGVWSLTEKVRQLR